MRLPICTFDAKTGILCPKCEGKLKSGHLTQADVDISIKLMKIAPHVPELDKISVVRAYDIDGSAVLALTPADIVMLRADYMLFKKIEQFIGGKLWVVEAEATDRKVLEDVFFPVRIMTVNQVWLPDGSKMTKVIISGRKTERFPLDIEQAKKVVKTVKGMELLVSFERQ